MLLETSAFGKINVSEEKIIYFKNGIPGFEQLKKYVIVILEQTSPFIWLQSVDEDILFPVISPFEIDPKYSPFVDDKELEEIKIEDEKDLLVVVICVVPEDFKQITANMAAPIVINTKAGLGKQILINEDKYKVRQPILDFIAKNFNGGKDARTDSQGG